MVVVFCCVLFWDWNDIWIVWWIVREWREVDLSSGKSLTIRIYSGTCDADAMTKFAFVKSLKSMEIPNTEGLQMSVEIPNTEGLQMSVDNVELLIKERDLEYNLEFCDIFVTGTIL